MNRVDAPGSVVPPWKPPAALPFETAQASAPPVFCAEAPVLSTHEPGPIDRVAVVAEPAIAAGTKPAIGRPTKVPEPEPPPPSLATEPVIRNAAPSQRISKSWLTGRSPACSAVPFRRRSGAVTVPVGVPIPVSASVTPAEPPTVALVAVTKPPNLMPLSSEANTTLFGSTQVRAFGVPANWPT
ncbi:hypothetical protein MKK75_02795 [Methylobacterium sp. J-030]|uniref:hypothetical protein n=1 Tax=Methylobacterium sp. J-030 TaxID=2836627 RepID=UPI001FB9CE8E|nr:hypothetical protein [Methylobacterium sp. J-030]MCJ2067742.1 hypothetical protein [Methylobacterium sp. J-030]